MVRRGSIGSKRVSVSQRGDGHDEQAGQDELEVWDPFDLANAVAERTAEDGEEEHGRQNWQQNRLRPERQDTSPSGGMRRRLLIARYSTSLFQAKSEGYIEDVLTSPLRPRGRCDACGW